MHARGRGLALSMPAVSNESQPGSRVGHEVDRTLVERRTYAVGQEAIAYLDERDTERLQEVMDAVGVRPGTAQVFVQVDSGAVPVGEFVRPKRNPMDKTQEFTPVRRLPKGRRPKTKREVCVVEAWQPGQVRSTTRSSTSTSHPTSILKSRDKPRTSPPSKPAWETTPTCTAPSIWLNGRRCSSTSSSGRSPKPPCAPISFTRWSTSRRSQGAPARRRQGKELRRHAGTAPQGRRPRGHPHRPPRALLPGTRMPED